LAGIILEKQDKIAILTINRPEKRNALDRELRLELYEKVKAIADDNETRAMVITGAGEAFVAGADIATMKGYDVEKATAASKEGSEIFSFIENMKIPIIAAVNGWALGGGCELALACDIRICSDNAKFGQTEVRIGILPGYGANIRLPRLVGMAKAKEMIFTGSIIDALEAEKIGLVNQVVPQEALMEQAIKMAAKIARGPASVSLAKQSINKAFDLDMPAAIALSSNLYGEAYNTHDAFEGIGAYLEKRRPEFTGK